MKATSNDHAFTATDPRGIQHEPTFAGALSFLRRKYTKELAGIDVAVTGIPLDTATTNRPGARFGPRAIREASTELAWARPYGWNFSPLDQLATVDFGDCRWDHGRPEEIPAAIEAHADAVLAAGAAMLSLGGDHFISYPLLKAHAKRYGPLSLIHFDAHSDTWNDAEGTGRVDHGTMFYHAAREGLVDPARSVQIGLRTHNDDHLGFNVLDAPLVHENGAKAVSAEAKRIVGNRKAYLTFDIDCLDPSFAPGTGTPVCGGLSTATAFAILKGLAGIDFVGMDLVEVAPAYDIGGITALAGATIAYEWLALYALRPGGPIAS
ncbi:agmatinase [Rhodospirillaceae bacterium SYSU D60014]|uniref:agmatinase n=1 Tax=Virgifigura deserti TaxID=2268457 RepID=UPI000E669190